MNSSIRSAVSAYIAANGPTNTRTVIYLLANQFQTTKQRISGNISFMVCRAGTLQVIRNKPNSVIY